MRLATDLTELLWQGCEFAQHLNFDNATELSFKFSIKSLTEMCPGNFQLERIEFMLRLLRISSLELLIYETFEKSKAAVAAGKVDGLAHAVFVKYEDITIFQNITFVSPFVQDRICLMQPVNASDGRRLVFDDKYWIHPYNAVFWIFVLFMICLRQIFLINWQSFSSIRKQIMGKRCSLGSYLIITACATFM